MPPARKACRAKQEWLPLGNGIKLLLHQFAQQGKRQFGINAGGFSAAAQRFNLLHQTQVCLALAGVARVDQQQTIDQAMQGRAPLPERTWCGSETGEGIEFTQQLIECAKGFRLDTAYTFHRPAADLCCSSLAGTRRGLVIAIQIAGKQALHAPGEAVFGIGGKAEPGACVGVNAPGHTCLGKPLLQSLKRAARKSKGARNGRKCEQVQHLLGGDARAAEIEQCGKRTEQRV